MFHPKTYSIPTELTEALRGIFVGRGHHPAQQAKNPYIAFEVRTERKSIFTLYTSGKLVITPREGDGEGVLLLDAVCDLIGAKPSGGGLSPGQQGEEIGEDTIWAGGMDETGTGELIGSMVVGGALMPRGLMGTVANVVGGADTKGGRTDGGWQRLGGRLVGLRGEGLVTVTVPIPNRVFDRYSKNALLDLTYIRAFADLLAVQGVSENDSLEGMFFAIDDYGVGEQLTRAVERWRGRGAQIVIENKADDRHLATRVAAIIARSQRAREMAGLRARVEDGPLGSGNAGDIATLSWLARRGKGGQPWPSFVKTSFRTVRDVEGAEPVKKEDLPSLESLLDFESAESLLSGHTKVQSLKLEISGSGSLQRIAVDETSLFASGKAGNEPALFLLPLLCGGLVLDQDLMEPECLSRLDKMLDPEDGLLAGWRVFVQPKMDENDPALVTLARAHASGVIHLVPTRFKNPIRRAKQAGAALVTLRARRQLCLRLDS